MGRAHHETGAGEVGGGSRGIRQLARVGRARSHELPEAAPQWPRWNHSAGCKGPHRNCPQHSPHGLGILHCAEAGSGNPAPRLAGEYRRPMETIQWRDYLGNAIRYWEPRRILYNLLLAAIVVIHFV